MDEILADEPIAATQRKAEFAYRLARDLYVRRQGHGRITQAQRVAKLAARHARWLRDGELT